MHSCALEMETTCGGKTKTMEQSTVSEREREIGFCTSGNVQLGKEKAPLVWKGRCFFDFDGRSKKPDDHTRHGGRDCQKGTGHLLHSSTTQSTNTSTPGRDFGTSEFKEYHKKQSIKLKIERGESENWAHVLKNQSKELALIRDLEKIIHNLGNVELFKQFEVCTETQCSSCAQYWPDGVLYCICGQCLLPSEKQRLKTKEKFDLLSIPNFIKKKGASRGARHGKKV